MVGGGIAETQVRSVARKIEKRNEVERYFKRRVGPSSLPSLSPSVCLYLSPSIFLFFFLLTLPRNHLQDRMRNEYAHDGLARCSKVQTAKYIPTFEKCRGEENKRKKRKKKKKMRPRSSGKKVIGEQEMTIFLFFNFHQVKYITYIYICTCICSVHMYVCIICICVPSFDNNSFSIFHHFPLPYDELTSSVILFSSDFILSLRRVKKFRHQPPTKNSSYRIRMRVPPYVSQG